MNKTVKRFISLVLITQLTAGSAVAGDITPPAGPDRRDPVLPGIHAYGIAQYLEPIDIQNPPANFLLNLYQIDQSKRPFMKLDVPTVYIPYSSIEAQVRSRIASAIDEAFIQPSLNDPKQMADWRHFKVEAWSIFPDTDVYLSAPFSFDFTNRSVPQLTFGPNKTINVTYDTQAKLRITPTVDTKSTVKDNRVTADFQTTVGFHFRIENVSLETLDPNQLFGPNNQPNPNYVRYWITVDEGDLDINGLDSLAATIGTQIGAMIGTFVFPVVGTLIGGLLGFLVGKGAAPWIELKIHDAFTAAIADAVRQMKYEAELQIWLALKQSSEHIAKMKESVAKVEAQYQKARNVMAGFGVNISRDFNLTTARIVDTRKQDWLRPAFPGTQQLNAVLDARPVLSSGGVLLPNLGGLSPSQAPLSGHRWVRP